ncbi:hypothetical protein Tco_0104853 [Tanacetum coccineum]
MESSTSSLPNQPYSPINPTSLEKNFEDLMFSQEYNYSQDYSMGHGSGHGLAPGSAYGSAYGSVHFTMTKTTLLSKRCHPSNLRSPRDVQQRPRKNSISGNGMKAKGFWEAVISQGRKKSKTSKTTLRLASGGLNLNEEADEVVEETQEFRPMGRDQAKAKKKATGSSHEEASSFVDLVAKKFYNMKQKNRERRTRNNSPI